MSRICKIALAQLTSTTDKQRNFDVVKKLVEKAKNVDPEVKMIFFPECFAFIGDGKTKGYAEPLDGELFGKYKNLALDNKLWISYGGFPERSSRPEDVENNRGYNTHIIVNDNGEIVTSYKKLHLFDVDIPEKSVKLLESEHTLPGNSIVTCESPIGTLGVSICYDVRFPELYCHMSVNLGAKVLLIPAAFTVPTGQAHWEVLLRSRAIENQCFVIAAATYGRHNEKRTTYGHSLVVDPWGEILCDMNQTVDDIQIVDLNLERQDIVRRDLPSLKHRRKDIYNIVV
ncbi:nitrilase [Acrasis kona]|uniref:Nitrilase n=1 Tax=Acrasis kona TaxID=1008807 RepID=A0AAW2Z0Q2_9EUKA